MTNEHPEIAPLKQGRRTMDSAESSRCEPEPSCRSLCADAAGLLRACSRVALTLRVWLLAMGHLVCFAAIYWLAFALRFDFAIPPESLEILRRSLAWVLVAKFILFYVCGHYHGWLLYVTFADLMALVRAAVLSLLVIAALDVFVFPYSIHRSVLILDCALTIIVFGALRASWRLAREQFWPSLRRGEYHKAVLVGADRSSGLLAHQIHAHASLQYRICGFLGTNGERRGQRLGQIPVLGQLGEIKQVAAKYAVTDVLLSAGKITAGSLRQLMTDCDEAKLTLKIIPPVDGLFNGTRQIPIRDIDITDLLRREPIELDCTAIREFLQGRRVLVTGAGGSIGSEICRQVLKFQPDELVLVGRGENRIFAIDMELRELGTATRLCPVIGDVADEQRMRQVFEEYRPEIVFHAAAHKHVPLMEFNVAEAVRNNVFGTRCIADLSDEYDVKAFVLISTDKAVNPSSVMGTTKQLAERYVHARSENSATRFVVVRFGNVLGSAGSVVPIFKEQICRGGPITVTDERMKRYFMTIPEASQLVLQAAAMGKGGEIFVLDMGEPVRIVDLARDMIRLAGLPENAIEIVYTGVRPGEKLYEELYFDEETTLPTAHPKVRAAYHRPYGLSEVRAALAELEGFYGESAKDLRAKLRRLVPEFTPPPAQALSRPSPNVA